MLTLLFFGMHPGEVLLGDLYRSGFEVIQDHEEADVVVVNTCAFVGDAKEESLEVRRNPRVSIPVADHALRH